MKRLRQATCDACSGRIDRLYVYEDSVNPVFCHKCLRKLIQWLHEIDCLDNHVFGSGLALGISDHVDSEGRVRVWIDSSNGQYTMREIYVRVHPLVEKNA